MAGCCGLFRELTVAAQDGGNAYARGWDAVKGTDLGQVATLTI